MEIESKDLKVVWPKQDNMLWAMSIEMLAQVPLINAPFGTRACIGFTVRSLDAEEKTMRRFVLEISVIASSSVKG